MREMTLEEIKKVEIKILDEFAKICEEQRFRYSLAGGTLLGAIRHKGFIPWDDDIDVLMPRPDYDKFCGYCKTHNTPFEFMHCSVEEDYHLLFTKLCSRNTTLKATEGCKSEGSGVFIDVFPIEGLGDTYNEAVKCVKSTKFLRDLFNLTNVLEFRKSTIHGWWLEPLRYARFILSRLISHRKLHSYLENRFRKHNFETCKFVGGTIGAYPMKEIMEREIYTQYIAVDFEGEKFKGLKEYDKYLTNLYGNYMKLPPHEQRVTHHGFKAYWKD